MQIPKVITIDFETAAIQPRPNYPPKPCGVSVKYPGRSPKYYAWGHPEGNNCHFEEGRMAVNAAYKTGERLLYQNSKFDLAVAERWMGMKLPP